MVEESLFIISCEGKNFRPLNEPEKPESHHIIIIYLCIVLLGLQERKSAILVAFVGLIYMMFFDSYEVPIRYRDQTFPISFRKRLGKV